MLINRNELKKLAEEHFGNDSLENQNLVAIIFSVAYTARTSYTKIGEDENLSFEQAYKIFEKCKKGGHFSVFTHIGRAMSKKEYNNYFRGKLSEMTDKKSKGWNKNFKGFVQLRTFMDK